MNLLTTIKLLDMRYPTEQSKNPKRWALFGCSYCDTEFEGQKDSYSRQDHCGCQRNKDKKKHGLCGTRQYGIWQNMNTRCTNPKYADYHRYGGRGIGTDWKSFVDFWEDMEEGYTEDMTLDRIDVNKGYSKDNCQWLTLSDNIKKMHQDKNDYIEYLENKIKDLERRINNGY